MKQTLLLLVLLFNATLWGQGDQKLIDSLLHVLPKQKTDIGKCQTMNELANYYFQVDPQKGNEYADKALALSSKIGYKEGVAFAQLYKGIYLFANGEYDNALSLYGKSGATFKQLNDYCSLGRVLLNTGNVYGNLSKYPDGLDAFLNAVRAFEKCKNKKTNFYLANCYQNIANIYNATENNQKALDNYERAIKLYQGYPGQDVSIAMNVASKGLIYQRMDKLKEAMDVYQQAEKQLLASHEIVPLAYVYSWMGSGYLDLKAYEKSIETSNKALTTLNEIGDQDLVATTKQNVGAAYLGLGKQKNDAKLLELGFINVNEALALHKQLNRHESMIQEYGLLADYYSAKNDYKKSLDAYKLFNAYHDSVFNFKNKQSLQNLEDQRTIELRDKQLQINKFTLESKERQKWFYILGIVSLIIILGLIFWQSRNRKKTNVKLQMLNAELDSANKVKARFFSILNHDLRSPVSSLISFLHLQKESPELLNEESRKRMENQTISSAENLLESMEDILLWSKGQMENFSPQPKEIKIDTLFEDVQKHFSNVENVNLIFENLQNIALHTDENYLKTILRNIIGNSVKALHDTPNATIVLRAANKSISVSDNGPGGTSEQFRALYDEKEVVGIKTGLGLHLIRDLAKAINCHIAVDTKPGEGTVFKLSFQ